MIGQRHLRIAVSSLMLMIAKGALGCEPMHIVQYQTDGGNHDIRLNGVLVKSGDGYSGVVKLDQGLLDGENVVTVTYDAASARGSANFAVHAGCEGGFPDEHVLVSTEIHGSGKQDLIFDTEIHAGVLFPGIIATNGDGLIEAVQELQAAVRRRDAEAVFALHEPLLSKMAERGAPMDRINAHVTKMLTTGEITLTQNLFLTPVLDGMAWEALTSSNQPPVIVRLEEDGGQYEWTSGTRWIFVEESWYIIEP